MIQPECQYFRKVYLRTLAVSFPYPNLGFAEESNGYCQKPRCHLAKVTLSIWVEKCRLFLCEVSNCSHIIACKICSKHKHPKCCDSWFEGTKRCMVHSGHKHMHIISWNSWFWEGCDMQGWDFQGTLYSAVVLQGSKPYWYPPYTPWTTVPWTFVVWSNSLPGLPPPKKHCFLDLEQLLSFESKNRCWHVIWRFVPKGHDIWTSSASPK